MANTVSSSDWSKLHEDILLLIFKKFTSVSDYLRFGAVCVSWRNLFVSHLHPNLLHPQLPLLLIPTPPSSSSSVTALEKQTRSFYSISEKRIYKDIEINLPYNRHCRGSSHGWLITSGEDRTSAVELINPLVSINNECLKIKLPPLTALPDDPYHYLFCFHYISKAVLSANPLTNPKNYVVMAIYGSNNHLAYWKSGELVWNPVPWSGQDDVDNTDIIYHKGMFYIANFLGNVFVCDLGSAGSSISDNNEPHRPITVRKLASPPYLRHLRGIENYLVKFPSSGDLLLLHRFHRIQSLGEVVSPHKTFNFFVFKLLIEDKEKLLGDKEEEEEEEEEEGTHSSKWELMRDLENRVFFVGNNDSMSLLDSEFLGGKPNHIYFTCDNWYHRNGDIDIGAFDYEGRSIEEIHPMGSNDYILPITTIWVEPTLRCCLRF